jgi:transaldolase/glucose-6-phosphate isomerase
MNPLRALGAQGQSVWLDFIRRSLIATGELGRLIERDGLCGVTSNPAIFEKAIAGSDEYLDAIAAHARERGVGAAAIYEKLAIRDIQDAADVLRGVYESTRARDGYVSLEVSPFLARDTAGTVAEARRLWAAVGRPNVMIKVPATPEGVPAVRELIASGINVNVTLLFSRAAYEQVALAYQAGIEELVARGRDPGGVASVASFFVSRIDTAVDALLAERGIAELQGKTAIANARLAYARYKELFAGPRWERLAAKGARTQRLLWASTGTKDPRYSDVLYVEGLIGKDTVSTIPPATWDAFRDHGKVRPTLEEDLDGARKTLAALAEADISLDEVTAKLLADALRLFEEPFQKLIDAVERRRRAVAGAAFGPAEYRAPAWLAAHVDATLAEWRAADKVRRLWAKDATVFTGKDEGRWLGWLDVVEESRRHLGELTSFAAEVKAAGFTHALLIGMGGSSLAPEVLERTLAGAAGFPKLHVLDSTDPAQIAAFERRIDMARTLFIVSSKSGTTLEPNILKDYFFERAGRDGTSFVAVTDPGSRLEEAARRDGFRRVFAGVPSVGGRYSALSNFGLVPAAVAGIDVAALLDRAAAMAEACGPAVDPAENPGVRLGAFLGTLARHGRDKLTIAASPGIAAFGAWLEQLIAESTGKEGKGIIPIDLEPLGPPESYGRDRAFVYLRLERAPDAAQDAALDAIERAGHPLVRISLPDPPALGAEFFRFEVATATAGAVLGINPFDQPDVEAAKIEARKLMEEVERTGALPAERPLRIDDPAAEEKLGALLAQAKAGDYVALLAYIEMTPEHAAALTAIRRAIRDRLRVATSVGFGPRFLHSTGQAYKGGPASGVFLQITADDAADLAVPGKGYTFGVVKAAQARGDLEVLVRRGRRALRVHLGRDVGAGLAALRRIVEKDVGGRP